MAPFRDSRRAGSARPGEAGRVGRAASWIERRLGHSGPKGYVRSDQRIREDVCDLLMDHEWVDSSNVEVRVAGGEVFLTGTVPDRASKRAIEDVAESVLGVADVHNDLHIVLPDDIAARPVAGPTTRGFGARGVTTRGVDVPGEGENAPHGK